MSHRKVGALRNDEDVVVTDVSQIKQMMITYFRKLFEKDEKCVLEHALKDKFPQLDEGMRNDLNKPFMDEEVKMAVFDMASLKAPGPDGLHAIFYQLMWNVVGTSVVSFIKNFLDSGIMPEGMNDTLITLVPKIEHPERVTHLRPISLFNVCYKVITKLMTNRLKGIMQEVIGPHQSSFDPNRQITDNVIIYQEALNAIRHKKGRNGFMAFKIDLEKAYDRLDWNFI